MTVPAPYASARDRRKALRVGVVTVLVVLVLLVVALMFGRQKDAAEGEIIRIANAAFQDGLAGRCDRFDDARAAYLQAMKHHFQSKELAGKAATANKLQKLCGTDLAAEIEARRKLVATGNFTPDDLKALAMAQLADADLDGALATLAKAPDDRYCRWLAQWVQAVGAGDSNPAL